MAEKIKTALDDNDKMGFFSMVENLTYGHFEGLDKFIPRYGEDLIVSHQDLLIRYLSYNPDEYICGEICFAAIKKEV